MSSFLFEQPLRLLFTCIFLLGLSGVFAWISQLTLWRRITLIALPVSALLVVMNVSVETEREELRGFLSVMFQQVKQQRLAGMLDLIDPSYNYDEVTYEKLVTTVTTRWKRYGFTNFQLLSWSFKKKADKTYDVEFACKAWLSIEGGAFPIDKTEWRLRIHRSTGKFKWQIQQIIPIEITNPIGDSGTLSLKRLMRMYR